MTRLSIVVVPANFQYHNETGVSVYGSSPTAQCDSFHNSVSFNETFFFCDDPASSVLFDGYIPAVARLDGDKWASQLLTLHKFSNLSIMISFDFTNTPRYRGFNWVELVVFNCPHNRSHLAGVYLLGLKDGYLDVPLGSYNFGLHPTTCKYLVKFCLNLTQYPWITSKLRHIAFVFFSNNDWVYIGEVTFYKGTGTCTSGPVNAQHTSNTPHHT